MWGEGGASLRGQVRPAADSLHIISFNVFFEQSCCFRTAGPGGMKHLPTKQPRGNTRTPGTNTALLEADDGEQAVGMCLSRQVSGVDGMRRSKSAMEEEEEEEEVFVGLPRQVSGVDGMRTRSGSEMQEEEAEEKEEEEEEQDVGMCLTRQVSGVDGMRRSRSTVDAEQEEVEEAAEQ